MRPASPPARPPRRSSLSASATRCVACLPPCSFLARPEEGRGEGPGGEETERASVSIRMRHHQIGIELSAVRRHLPSSFLTKHRKRVFYVIVVKILQCRNIPIKRLQVQLSKFPPLSIFNQYSISLPLGPGRFLPLIVAGCAVVSGRRRPRERYTPDTVHFVLVSHC